MSVQFESQFITVITGSEFGINKKISKIWTKIEQKKSKSKMGMSCIWSNRGHTFCSAKIFKISKPPETKSYLRLNIYVYVPDQIYFVNLALGDSAL